jgi:hypothetical protein
MAQDKNKQKNPQVQERINARVNFVKSKPNLDPYEARKRFFVQTRAKELEAAGKPVDRKALRQQFDTGKVKREGFYTPADMRKFAKGSGTGSTGGVSGSGKSGSSSATGSTSTSSTAKAIKGDEPVRVGMKSKPGAPIVRSKEDKGLSTGQKIGIGIAAYTVVQGLKAWDSARSSVIKNTFALGPGQMPPASSNVLPGGPRIALGTGSYSPPSPVVRTSSGAIPLGRGPLAIGAGGSSSAPAVRTTGVPTGVRSGPREITYSQFKNIVRTPPPKGSENARAQWIKQYPEYASQLVKEIKQAESGARNAVQSQRAQSRDTIRRWFGSGGVGGFTSPSGGPGNSGSAGGVRGGGGGMPGRGK